MLIIKCIHKSNLKHHSSKHELKKKVENLIYLKFSLFFFYNCNSVDGGSVGEPVKFGQKFGLGTTGGFSDPMVRELSCKWQLMAYTDSVHLGTICIKSYSGSVS